MATVDELLLMARDFSGQARASPDPQEKRKLMRLADDYLRQAEEIRNGRPVISAEFPNPERKIG
jgi:hypothetical protein